MATRLMSLLLDEMALARTAGKRLRRLVEWMMSGPANPGRIAAWATRIDMSARAMSRLISLETGISFGRWRRQLHLMLALQWLASGATVQDVADGLGYENASNFVAMFRKALGETPSRYLNSKI